MGKILVIVSWVLLIAGAIITRFVYEFPGYSYIIYLAVCVLLALLGYWLDKKKNSKKEQ